MGAGGVAEVGAGAVDVVDLQSEMGNAGNGGPVGFVVGAEDGDQAVGLDGGDVIPEIGVTADEECVGGAESTMAWMRHMTVSIRWRRWRTLREVPLAAQRAAVSRTVSRTQHGNEFQGPACCHCLRQAGFGL